MAIITKPDGSRWVRLKNGKIRKPPYSKDKKMAEISEKTES